MFDLKNLNEETEGLYNCSTSDTQNFLKVPIGYLSTYSMMLTKGIASFLIATYTHYYEQR